LAGLGLLTQATVVYLRALELDRTLGYRHLAVETTADLARVALTQSDMERATAYVATILGHLMEYGAAGTEEPVLLYLTCYQVLRARHDARAEELLAAGYVVLQGRAGQFEDVERRNLFLENVPAHRDLLRLWQHRRHLRGIAAVRDPGAGAEARASEEVEPAPLSLVRQGAVYQDAAVV
jgi:hypothetical protein